MDDILDRFDLQQEALPNGNNNGNNQNCVDNVKNHQIENELFLSLKFHIDSQYRLNKINQNRIRSFERFCKYCQRVAQSGDETKFDPEQFRNEYNRFDRNYRYWRKRIRKLRSETKFSLSIGHQSPYDILYELFVKIESLERIKESNLYETKIFGNRYLNPLDNVPVNNRSTLDQSIQCDIQGTQEDISIKRTRFVKTKTTRSQIYPEISIDVIEPTKQSFKSHEKVPVNNDSDDDFSPCDNGISSIDYSDSDSSWESSKAKTIKSNRKSSYKKLTAKKVRKVSKLTKSSKKQTTLKQEKQSGFNSDFESDCQPKQKKKRGRPKNPDGPKVTKYYCDFEGCQYFTTYSWYIKKHKRSHSEDRPFPCDRCELAFKCQDEWKRHQNVHDRVRFNCTFEGCTANYSNRQLMLKHVRVVHTKEAPLLQCDWEGCRYSGYDRKYLKIHRRIHMDERPHKCPHCEMTYKTAATLWSHRLKHKNGNIWKCDFDGCGYSSYRNEYLKLHKLTHSEERPFSCAWPGCGDSFKTGNILAKHMQTHENLRKYKCKWEGCNYASNVSHGVRCHVLAVHEKKKKPRIRKKQTKTNLLDSSLECRVFE